MVAWAYPARRSAVDVELDRSLMNCRLYCNFPLWNKTGVWPLLTTQILVSEWQAVSKFPLGKLVATPGAIAALEAAHQLPLDFIRKHVSGDWGIVCPEDKQANEDALRDGSRIFSAYLLTTGTKIWVITEAVNDNNTRESTCILLPDEY
jgi:hypothetical protein